MMRSLLPLLSVGACVLSSLSLLPLPIVAKKDGPTIKTTTFDGGFDDVFYFDDSNVVLGIDSDAETVYRSDNAGETWEKVNDDGQAGHSYMIWAHPHDNQRAYILTHKDKHWMTTDQGKQWNSFTMSATPQIFSANTIRFHGRDPKKAIWNGESCHLGICDDEVYYTEDDFRTIHMMGKGMRSCQWAVTTPMFGEEIATVVDNRVVCIKEGMYSTKQKDNRIVVSDNFFQSEDIEPLLDNGRAVPGIISTAAVKKYLVAAAKSEGTDELALYVTDDSSEWHRAEFGQHKVQEDAYTILESTNYSMQVDVLGSRPWNPMGYLFTSNSNGTYFTRNIDHTNRNSHGRVDFEKVQGIQGIVLVNTVDNWQEVEKHFLADKKIVSKISFDDGRTFEDLKVGRDTLHLHSVTNQVQEGRVFSSPAPGIVMGVGNTGKFLKDYRDCDLFVSNDAGRTWSKALDGAQFYEFGNNGAILVAADSSQATSHISYSLNHGKDWSKANLDQKVSIEFLTTIPDSTTRSFLMMGSSRDGSKSKYHLFKIDFDGLHERTCKDKDFEKWSARVDEDGKPSCIMGHQQFFRRRKQDADCFIDNDFKDPQPEFEPCVCTEQDFECDYNFVRDQDNRSRCNPVAPLQVPEGECKKESDTFQGSSGWRLIPGNECIRKGGVELDKEVERPCTDTFKQPISDQVEAERTDFAASQFSEFHYLERGDTSEGHGETIIMHDSEQKIWLSNDHGKQWQQILKGEPITQIVPNPYFHERVYFLTGSDTVHYSIDRGEHFDKFTAPMPPAKNNPQVLKFHPHFKESLLWAGADGSRTNMYFSKDRGDHWQTLRKAADKCDYVLRDEKDQLIFCAQHQNEDNSKDLQLVSSNNFFEDEPQIHFQNIQDFATMAEFIIVAAKAEDQTGLRVDASVDGATFAEARFPKNFQVEHQQAYTVLDSSTHAVFLHVTINADRDREYGAILKSNSNGTSYVMSINAVNRDKPGYVDFEKMQGLEGVAMVNVVENYKEVDTGEKKKLKSMITHSDGALWDLIPPPKKDALGKDYDCVGTDGVATQKCSLHLHSYTERADKTATFSSPSAIGLMMAIGNVGEYLGRKDSEHTDTFITRDAGITWQSVKKGTYMWEYGDQGSIIVIVPESVATRSVFYTLDEGQTWTEFEFSKVDMVIDEITTVPTDNSFNFLLWGKETGARGKISTVNLDFSQLSRRQKQCRLDENSPTNGDYDLWQPKHPQKDDNCLFGHVAQYHRKKIEADCFNGKAVPTFHSILRNCTCRREDYECDYNYQMHGDGSCALVEGLVPQDHEQYCKDNPDAIEFWKATGYRKIPLDTCEGGQELDKVEVIACPGHEKEFKEKHGLSGAALFFAVVIPVAAAAAVGYWVWQQYQKYGFGNFGQIRLGDSGGTSTSTSRSGTSPWISVPVAIIAGTWAVVKATPLLVSSLYRSARGYMPVSSRNTYSSGPYRSRDAFSSRRQDYSTAAFVEDDELLGDEDEHEGDEV